MDDICYAGSHGMDIISPVGSNRFGGHGHHHKIVDEKVRYRVYLVPLQGHVFTVSKISVNTLTLVTQTSSFVNEKILKTVFDNIRF